MDIQVEPRQTGEFVRTRKDSQVAQVVKDPPTNAGDADVALIPGRKDPRDANGNPPQ